MCCTGFISSCSDDYLDSSTYFKDRLTEEKVFESKVYSEEWLANVFEELRGINADVASKGVTPHNFADDMYYGDRDSDYDPSKMNFPIICSEWGNILKMTNRAPGSSLTAAFAMHQPSFIIFT